MQQLVRYARVCVLGTRGQILYDVLPALLTILYGLLRGSLLQPLFQCLVAFAERLVRFGLNRN